MNTRGSAVVLGVAALALLAQVSAVLGKGKITGLILSLPAVQTCFAETITVKGTGRCLNLEVNYGDFSQGIHLSRPGHPIKFPAMYYHAYSKSGTYKVRAQSQQDKWNTCPGTASATVQVVGPQINSIVPFSAVTPGGGLILVGENFGNLPGQLWIHLKDFKGKPVDYQLLDSQNQWGDTFAGGTVPNIPGVLDQQATLTVVAQCGAVSNAWPAHFTAAIDVADLAFSPWAGTNPFGCSMSSGVTDHDACEDQGGLGFPPECAQNFPGWPLAPGNIGNLAGYHDFGWGFTGNDGTDQYWLNAPLQNGWVLDSTSAEVTTQVSAAGQSSGGQVSVDGSQSSDPAHRARGSASIGTSTIAGRSFTRAI